MSELTPEELALLAAAEPVEPKKPRKRAAAIHRPAPAAEPPAPVAEFPAPTATACAPAKRGPITPAQWDDDGWGDTPVQMRG